MNKGLKIPQQYDNPYDNLNYSMSAYVSDFFKKKLNFTPNKITTLAVISWIISAIILYYTHDDNKYILLPFVIFFYLLSYFLDCFDGFFARKYDMITNFGDMYDHISDWTKSLVFLVLFYLKMDKKIFGIYIAIIIIAISIMFVQIGCQEKLYNNDNKHVLGNLKPLCSCENPNDIIKYSRYFGCGTPILITSIFMIFATK